LGNRVFVDDDDDDDRNNRIRRQPVPGVSEYIPYLGGLMLCAYIEISTSISMLSLS
jgi:hypothetical protein